MSGDNEEEEMASGDRSEEEGLTKATVGGASEVRRGGGYVCF